MNTRQPYIVGDWGTSHLRLYLCRNGEKIDMRSGPGIAKLHGSPAEIFTELTSDWHSQHGPCYTYLIGMAGANIGWHEAPYVACPANLQDLQNKQVIFDHNGYKIHIIAGLSCINRLGVMDVMRSEETQIFGAMELRPELKRGRHLICLTGTHTKWALVEDAKVINFNTAFTGEMYDLLIHHSVLAHGAETQPAFATEIFEQALERVIAQKGVSLLHSVFEVRSLQAQGLLERSNAPAWLSGLLIGEDLINILDIFSDCISTSSTLIFVGNERLSALYARAAERLAYTAICLDSADTTLAGLSTLHQGNKHAVA